MLASNANIFLFFIHLLWLTNALRYDAEQVQYNLNTNKDAREPVEYSGEWQNHTFTPSPVNWRVPFYTVLLDRFVNGNPTNDDANGTQYEQDVSQTTLRHGGDIKGLQDSLDYLQGMGIKVSAMNLCIRLATDDYRFSILPAALT